MKRVVTIEMKWPWLRFNLHHYALAVFVILLVGMIWDDWPVLLAAPVCIVLVAVISYAIARPASSLFYPTLTHGPRDSRQVALSFDDGPDPDVTPLVLQALAAHASHATFFTIGQAVERYPELARRMVEEGHVLGNHSWQHSRVQNFRLRKWQREEIARGERAIRAITGTAHAGLYRPPMGLKIGELGRELWRRRLVLVAWSLHSHDTRLHDATQIAERVLGRVRGGDIILLHDGHDLPHGHRPHCVEALRLILQGLEQKGLKCVTVPQLLSGANTEPRSPSSQPGQQRVT